MLQKEETPSRQWRGADSASWSGRPDSNRRPRAPKARALTRLRYAPTPLQRRGDYTGWSLELDEDGNTLGDDSKEEPGRYIDDELQGECVAVEVHVIRRVDKETWIDRAIDPLVGCDKNKPAEEQDLQVYGVGRRPAG